MRDIFGLGGEDNSGGNEKQYPPFNEQLRKYIDTVKISLKKKKKSTIVIISLLTVLGLYLAGAITTIIRSIGSVATEGFSNAEKASFNPISAFLALFDIKYSIWGILVVLILFAAALYWWIRNHVSLGDYSVEERSGAKYKKQVQDATLGSAREMNEEEVAKNFLVVSEHELKVNNPNTIIYGKLPDTGDFVMAKPEGKYDAPNSNAFVCGDAGSRKTSNFILPTLMQICRAGRNCLCTDSSGEVFAKTYKMFLKNNYNIRVFNTVNPKRSDCWNFVGSIGPDDINLAKAYAQTIVESTENPNMKSDKYFIDGMLSLLPALMLYVNQDKNSNTIEQVLHIITNYDLDQITTLFHSLDKNTAAYKQFRIFETSPVKANFLNNAAERLDMFVSADISRICSSDGIDIVKELGDENVKTIIYIITDKTYAFISALFLNAATKLLTAHARDNCKGFILPRKVYVVYEEFLTMGYVPNMGDNLSETRKYGLVFILICQAIPQFFRKYGELEAREIMESCKYKLLFGAGGPATAEEFEKYCGPATVRTSMTAMSSPIVKTTDQLREGEQQRMLYDYNELMTFDEEEYMLFTTHLHPLRLKKPFYKFLPDADKIEDFHLNQYTPDENNVYKPPVEEHIETVKEETSSEATNPIHKSGNAAAPKKIKTVERVVPKNIPKKQETEELGPLLSGLSKLTKERPLINDDEVHISVKDGRTYFNVEYDRDNNLMRAYKVVFDIPLDVKINGVVPENQWVKYHTQYNINFLRDRCKLSKENCILIGWSLNRDDNGKSTKYLYEKEKTSIWIPQSNVVIKPIFKSIPGTEGADSIQEPEQMTLMDITKKDVDMPLQVDKLNEKDESKVIPEKTEITSVSKDDTPQNDTNISIRRNSQPGALEL